MPTIHDFAKEYGALTLERRPFDALDALILTQLVYMPMEGRLDKGESCTTAQAWAFLHDNCDPSELDQFQRKRYALMEVCAHLPRYSEWVMSHYENHIDDRREMQFCACTWDTRAGTRFIAFRGTDLSIAGWKEDLNMSFMTVPSQQEAADYVNREARLSGNILMLGGHSKGGNLAVYAGVYVEPSVRERLRRVYCFDGPGLDEKTLHSEGYALIRERIESYIPQSSVVGMLLHYHPVYAIVRSDSIGILQHDAMTWQVCEGAFELLPDLDMSGKITDEALHAWLAEMDMEARRLLVNTLYSVVEASRAEQITDLTEDWFSSSVKMLEAIRELSPDIKRDVRRMLRSLFSTGASKVIRAILPQLKTLGQPGKAVEQPEDQALPNPTHSS